MKVAAIQMAPVWGDKKASLRKGVDLIAQAAKKGAKLIVLPELAFVGYSHKSPEEAMPLSEAISPDSHGLTMKAMTWLTKRLNVTLVWGMIERDAGTRELFNSQVYLDPTGYMTSMRKINPFGNDYLWASRGRSNPPIVLNNGKRIGMLICRDIRNRVDSTWTALYQRGDADIVCFSSAWGDGGFPSSTWVDFATGMKTTLVVANRYGQEENNNFGEGGACIILPNGKVVIDGLEFSKDCMVLAEV